MRRLLTPLALLLAAGWACAQPVQAPSPPASGPTAMSPSMTPDGAGVPVVTAASQRVWEQHRASLVQVRTLLRSQDSQSSVGSGFVVTPDGHLMTNYHVVSDHALDPAGHRLVYVTQDGRQGALDLLAVDVVHDLALLKPVQSGALAGRAPVAMRAASEPLARGARIFSLGNPLDVGFAVNEGAFNGLVDRSYLPILFFGGSLSPGMSGGPAVDERGRLVGVNVARRQGGEQVSFLVPAEYAAALLARGRAAAPVRASLEGAIAEQLLAYQSTLVQRFVALPWHTVDAHGVRVPVPDEAFMRCWGEASREPQGSARTLGVEQTHCSMDGGVFVSSRLETGTLAVRHEIYDGSRIGALRFSQRHSASFANESFGNRSRDLTNPQCTERSVRGEGPPLRVVVCMAAYRRLPGLYNVSVLAATLNGAEYGVLGRFDADGVGFPQASQLTSHYLNGFAWTRASPPSN